MRRSPRTCAGAAALWATTQGCAGRVDSTDDVPCDDRSAPQLTHAPPASLPEGGAFVVEAAATDDCELFFLSMLFREDTSVVWTSFDLTEVDSTGRYQGRIDDLQPPAFNYFLTAVDREFNETCLPAECGDAPFRVPVD